MRSDTSKPSRKRGPGVTRSEFGSRDLRHGHGTHGQLPALAKQGIDERGHLGRCAPLCTFSPPSPPFRPR